MWGGSSCWRPALWDWFSPSLFTRVLGAELSQAATIGVIPVFFISCTGIQGIHELRQAVAQCGGTNAVRVCDAVKALVYLIVPLQKANKDVYSYLITPG